MGERRQLFTAAEASAWCGGTIFGNSTSIIFGAEVDSRNCTDGVVFFALKGEHVDGHDYISGAFERGAAGAVVSVEWLKSDSGKALTDNFPPGLFLISVDNPLHALQSIAAGYLRGVSGPIRIGVTGSNGKTTTKELIAGILSERYSVVKTAGNYNSEIGLPLTVFNINSSYEYAVIEMGVNRVGEMDVLAEILRPDIVVITNIGTAHIGIFNSIEKIAFEKRRSVSKFDGNGTLFVSENEPFRQFLKEGLAGTAVEFGRKALEAETGLLSCISEGLRGWRIAIEGRELLFPLPGEYNLQNAFCAAAVGLKAGLGVQEINAGLEKAEALFGRSEIIEGPVTIIQDCYNANGESMLSSIEFADGIEWPGEKCYVLGDMKELGENSRDIHVRAGRAAAESRAARVFFFGDDSIYAYEEAAGLVREKDGESPELFYTDDYGRLQESLVAAVAEGDLLLLKGSRSMNLERLVAPVEDKFRRAEC